MAIAQNTDPLTNHPVIGEVEFGIAKGKVPQAAHVAYFWETEREFAEGVGFLEAGLRGLDHCVVFGHEKANQAVCNVLQNDGFDVKDLLAQQRITILGGDPSGDTLLETIRGASRQSLARGAPLIRLLGNIGWGKAGWPGDYDLLAFEANVTGAAKEFPCVVLCMYEIAALPELVIRPGVYGTHPLIERDGTLQENPDFIPADFFLKNLELIADALSKQRQAQAESRSNEERFRSLFDHSTDAVLIGDPHGNIEAANPEACRLFGRTEEEIRRIGRAGLVDPTDTRLQVLLAEREQTGRFKGELNFRRKDGSVFLGEISSAFYKDKSEASKVSVIIRDITERKRVEHLISQVFECSPDAVSIVGRDYRYQRVNPGYARIGRPAERMVGMHVADSVGMEAFERTVKPNLDRCFAGEEIRYAEWFPTALGRRYLAVSYSPLRPDPGRVDAVLAIIRDLTEPMLASEALREAQAELAHLTRVATLGELTASIAHEINQPLSAIVTSASACLRWLEAQKLEEARRSASRVIAEGHRASEIIGRIRALAKKAPPQKDWLDVNETIHEVSALARSEIQRNGVAFETKLSEQVPLILADRVQLQQVILNLMMNAIEAMSGLSDGPRELLVRSSMDESQGVLVSLQDSGPGIDPQNPSHLFDAFYTTKPQGLGMGLAISRSIIEAHGGRLWATANPDKGATFHFTLPTGGGNQQD